MMLVNNGMKTWKEGRDLKKNNISVIFLTMFFLFVIFPLKSLITRP